MDKSRPKPTRDSSWNDESERMTNPNRRQEEDKEINDQSTREGQRASKTDRGSPDHSPSDRRDESQRDRQHTDTSRRQPQTDE